jgi:valyl-tRNA synthetase
VEPAKRIAAYLAGGEHYDLLVKHQEIITALARLDGERLELSVSLPEKPAQTAGQVIAGGIEIYLPLAGMIDLAAERERCQKEIAQLEKLIATSKTKLANPGFVNKAPAGVVEREREKLADLELQAAKTWDRLKELG